MEGGDFFKAALTRSWLENATNRIDLPEDEPWIVKLYVFYLYRKAIYIPVEYQKKSESSLAMLFIYTKQLLDFGTKVQDLRFRECVCEAARQIFEKKTGQDRHLHISRTRESVVEQFATRLHHLQRYIDLS